MTGRRKIDMTKYVRGNVCPDCGRAMTCERTDTLSQTILRYRYCIACDRKFYTRQEIAQEVILREVEKRS